MPSNAPPSQSTPWVARLVQSEQPAWLIGAPHRPIRLRTAPAPWISLLRQSSGVLLPPPPPQSCGQFWDVSPPLVSHVLSPHVTVEPQSCGQDTVVSLIVGSQV